MKRLPTAIALVVSLAFLACNSRNTDIEASIENPATSQEEATTSTAKTSNGTKEGDTINDATRLSDGKDSVKGEVTPPAIKDVY